MTDLGLTFCVTLAASVGLTALVRSLARHWGIVDQPDGQRKRHPGAVPLWGGIAVYCAMLLGLGVAAVPSMAMPGPDHPLLVSVPLVDPVVTRKVGLIRRRGRSLSPAAQQLFDLFGEVKGRRGALRRG